MGSHTIHDTSKIRFVQPNTLVGSNNPTLGPAEDLTVPNVLSLLNVYTVSQVDTLLSNKSNVGHTHAAGDISGLLAFGSIIVAGQTTIVANNSSSPLTFVAGSNITIATNATGDTITFNSTASGGGGGTVTHTAGPLVLDRIVLGAGGSDTKTAVGFDIVLSPGIVHTLNIGDVTTSGALQLFNSVGDSSFLFAFNGVTTSNVFLPPAGQIATLAGVETFTNKTLTDPVINVAGTDAPGDIYYRDAGGLFTRLGIGTNTHILTVTGGLPVWAAPSGGAASYTMATLDTAVTDGDVMFQGRNETVTGTKTLTAPRLATNITQTTEPTNTPAGTTQTVNLANGNHQTLTLTSATGTVATTITPPVGPSAGTIIVRQHATLTKGITWTVSSGSLSWIGTEPVWENDIAGTTRVVSWRYDGSVTYLSTGGGSVQNTFTTIAVAGQSSISPDTSTDTLTLVAGSNITITTNAATDEITISATGGGGGSGTVTNTGGALTTNSIMMGAGGVDSKVHAGLSASPGSSTVLNIGNNAGIDGHLILWNSTNFSHTISNNSASTANVTVTMPPLTGIMATTNAVETFTNKTIVLNKTVRMASEVTGTPVAGTQTIDLTAGQHQTLSLLSATVPVAVTLTVPATSSAGTIIVKQHASAVKVLTWNVSAGTIKWMGSQPDWASDIAGSVRIVSWRYDGSVMYLAATEIGA